jgi:hypothetical protein
MMRMTAYVSVKTGMPSRARRPLRWGDLAIGAAVLLLLGLALAAGRANPGLPLPPRLSPQEKAQVSALLAEARETRHAAVAFYRAMHEAEPASPGAPSPARVHAAEIDELVDAALRARLAETLGPTRAALAGRQFRPLATFLAWR